MEEDLRHLKGQLSSYTKPKLYKHYRNGKKYIITGKCMVQESLQWVDAVIYRWEGGEQLFVRSLEEFIEKFKLEG